jgi:type VI secretion system protein VasG
MSEISRVALFNKLNAVGYKAVEGATVFCKLRGNPYVEVVHWLAQLVQLDDSDLHRIIRHYDIDPSRLSADMTRALDALPRGASSISDLSEHLMNAMERAWVYGSLMFSSSQVRTSHLILGMLKTPSLRGVLQGISQEFAKIGPDDLADNLPNIVDGSPEDGLRPQDGSDTGGAVPGEASGAMAPANMGKEEALKQFCTDMTEQARTGKIDPIVGRDAEIRQIVDVLMRRRQNNPILTGRGRRGQDRGGRGLCAAHRARRRAARRSRTCASAVARCGPAAGGRVDEGRVRAPTAVGDRRGAGQPGADHHVRRRDAHAGRRGRCRGHG